MHLSRNTSAVLAAAVAIGLVASACPSSADPAQLQSLIPTPANTQRTDGPQSIPDNGIHMHFLVNGGGNDVRLQYRGRHVQALECRQHRNRRRNRPITVDQGRPE